MEGEYIYFGINQNFILMYINFNMSGKFYIDREFFEVEGKKRVVKFEDVVKGLVLDVLDIMLKELVLVLLDGREIFVSFVSRQNFFSIVGKLFEIFFCGND